MKDNIVKDGDIYCVSCGKPMTSEMGSMICPECQKYLEENTDNNKTIEFSPNPIIGKYYKLIFQSK